MEDVQGVEQDEEQHEKQVEVGMLSKSVDRVIRTRRNRTSGRYSAHTSGGGRLPDLVSFSSKLRGSEISSLIKWVLTFRGR